MIINESDGDADEGNSSHDDGMTVVMITCQIDLSTTVSVTQHNSHSTLFTVLTLQSTSTWSLECRIGLTWLNCDSHYRVHSYFADFWGFSFNMTVCLGQKVQIPAMMTADVSLYHSLKKVRIYVNLKSTFDL